MALIDDVLGRKITTRGRLDARSIASQLGNKYDQQLIDQYNRLQRNLKRAGAMTPAQIRAAELLGTKRGARMKQIKTSKEREAVIMFVTATTATARGARQVAHDQATNIRRQIGDVADQMYGNGSITADERKMIRDLMAAATDYQIKRLMEAYPDLYGRYKQDSNDYFEAISARFLAGIRQNQAQSMRKMLETMTKSQYVTAEKKAIADAALKGNISKNINAQAAISAIQAERGF